MGCEKVHIPGHPPKLESEFYVANINVSGEPYQIFVDLIET
ncbi:hypothetical protein H175_15p08 (plasmid) [Bacillus thuringiensis serovar thuringiensis str. IS5056]|nr:hypothetical protein CT43_P127010 [Bacillus thuringiensis serovar chinensis CT-43]AGG04388.1 hypothetical protein H175_15p08 [Bacillus thuringiensis serovar thuringiensis str. IS5056]EEM25738.1 hypothetical protein bthur0002_54300 [Bacillus thuringiensis Bt407]